MHRQLQAHNVAVADPPHIPAHNVTVTGCLNPFTFERSFCVGFAGESVRQMLLRLSGGLELPRSTTVFVGDRLVSAQYWDHVFPNNGVLVTVRANAHDSQMLRTVALIGVGVAAIAVSGGAAGGFLGPGFAAGTIGASAAGVATMAVGMLAIDALIPLSNPKFGSVTESATLAVTGARNTEKPFSPVPQILGTFRFTPPLAATPFTSLSGDNQDLTMLFINGYGPIAISDHKIGATDIDEFSGVEMEVTEGFSDDDPVSLYPGDTQQLDLNIRIYYGVWRQDQSDTHPDANPCTATGTPSGTWTITPPASSPYDVQPNCYVRTTPANCYKFRVDITFPNGLLRVKDQGDREKMTVDLEVWYRIDGTADDYVLGGSLTVEGKTTTTIRRSVEVTPTAADPEVSYEVLVRRLTLDDREGQDPDGDNTRYSASTWTALVAFSNTDPISDAQECMSQTALKITATSQLTGVIDNYSFLGTTICLDYDGTPGSWTQRPTNNPASLYRYVLQGKANGHPIADCRIDIDALEDWHDFCATKGFTYNAVRDFQSTVLDCLTDVAGAGRAKPTVIDGKWSVVVDNQDNYATPVQLFTPRNSWNFQAQKTFIDVPHAFRVRYVDAADNYQQTEDIIYDTGYTSETATRFESIEFPGLTNSTEVDIMARYQLACARLRQERYSFQCDIEHFACVQGDAIKLQTDSIGVGTGAARIESIVTNTITLDGEIEVPTSPSAVHRAASGTITTAAVTSTASAGELSDTYTFTSGLPAGAAVGDLVTIGESSSETLDVVVDSIIPGADDSATITCYPVAAATDVS